MIEVNACDTQVKIKLRGGTLVRPVKPGSYSFPPGINVLAGEAEHGGAGLSLLLSGRCGFGGCTVKIDGREVTRRELEKSSCIVGHAPVHSENVPFKRLAERGLRRNKVSGLTFDSLSERFMLTPERYGRPLAYMGNERLRASLALGYAYGKSIFCTTLLSAQSWEKLYRYALEPYLEQLREDGKTVILAVDDTEYAGEIVDNIYYFGKEE